jgi:hypothetical protein
VFQNKKGMSANIKIEDIATVSNNLKSFKDAIFNILPQTNDK